MAIEVFNRYEKKYLVPADKAAALQYRLRGYMELDENNKRQELYTITNLYYDTDDSQLIRTSLSKPAYKEKLRLRSYGVPGEDSTAYIEIKKKVAGLVNKRRSAIKLSQAYSFLESGILPEPASYTNTQVLSEVECILAKYAVKPVLFLAYDRKAYFASGQSDVRVSFDTNILARRCNLRLESGIYGQPLLEDDMWLMEIKVKDSIPIWLTRLLSEYRLYPTSFSKYGAEYKKYLETQKKIYTPLMEYSAVAAHPYIKMERGVISA